LLFFVRLELLLAPIGRPVELSLLVPPALSFEELGRWCWPAPLEGVVESMVALVVEGETARKAD